MALDYIVFNFSNNLFFLNGVVIFFATKLPDLLIASLFLFLLKNFRKYLPMVVFSVFSGLFTRFILTDLIRYFFYRPRPFVVFEIEPLFYHVGKASFPSGHASFFFALSTIIYFYNKKAGYIFFFFSFLISIARVMGGVHWPSDIIFGALLGILTSTIFWKIKGPFVSFTKGIFFNKE